jgi:hypothetical protein
MGSDKAMEGRIALMKKNLSPLGVEVRAGSIKEARLEGLLARGDRQVGRLLVRMLEHGENFGALNKAARELQIDLESYWGPWPEERPFPWSPIATGVKPEYLEKEGRKGLEGRITKGCPPPSAECHRCGVC